MNRCARTGRSRGPPATTSPTCSRAAGRSGGRGKLQQPLHRIDRPPRALRGHRARLQTSHHAKRDGERAQRARARRRPRGAAEPAHHRFHPQPPPARDPRNRRLLPGLSHLCGRGRRAAPTADRRDLDWAIARARRNETDIDPSVFDFLQALLGRPGGRSRAAASAAMPCCAWR